MPKFAFEAKFVRAPVQLRGIRAEKANWAAGEKGLFLPARPELAKRFSFQF